MSNINKNKKYHFIYKTTNLINGKFYIGMHSTSNLKDGYLGSGKLLKRSLKKYGEENFKLEILEYLNDRISLINREKEIINEEFLKDPLCMNIMKGGLGGFIDKDHQKKASDSGHISFIKKLKNDLVFKQTFSENCKLSNLKTPRGYALFDKNKRSGFKGKFHTKETKEKIGLISSETQKGCNNSQYNTCWIYSIKLKRNKKIKNEELQFYLKVGWIKGRKIKI